MDVQIHIVVFWVGGYQHLTGTYCLHLPKNSVYLSVFIYKEFDDTELNDQMTVNNEVERPNLSYYPGICLEGLRKSARSMSAESVFQLRQI